MGTLKAVPKGMPRLALAVMGALLALLMAVGGAAGDVESMALAIVTTTTARLSVTLDAAPQTDQTIYYQYRESGDSWPPSVYRGEASANPAFPVGTATVNVQFTTTANQAPVFSHSAVTRFVDENVSGGTHVGGPVTAGDPDGDVLTYTLGGTDAASFDIGASTGQISVGAGTTVDYETQTSYSVTVTATDVYNATDTATVAISVLDIREAGLLGRIVIEVGDSGDCGYNSSSSDGRLISGFFPGALFDDGSSRRVNAIYENEDSEWVFVYSGGATGDWNAVQEELDEVLVEVTYEDGRDFRSFVLGGFIESRSGYELTLSTPLPNGNRDWGPCASADDDGKLLEDVIIDFRRPYDQYIPPTLPPSRANPPAQSDSFIDFVTRTTPGGGVTAQMVVTILVYVMFLFKTPSSPLGIMLAAAVLILTPWGPFLLGFEHADPIAAAIVTVNVLAGAYVYKAFAARTES